MLKAALLGAAAAASIGLAVPAAAATTAQQARVASLPTAVAVAAYTSQHSGPQWLAQPGAAEALIEALRQSPLDGFDRGPDLAGSIERVVADAQAGVPGAAPAAEQLMGNAFVLYAQALGFPRATGVIFADPALAPRIPTPAELLATAARAPDLAAHVRAMVSANPLHAALRAAAAEDMRFLGQPSRALRASLDRTRMLPATGRLVLVDIASQQLMMIEDGTVVDRMKVVVGKADMKTPLMAGTLRQVTLNPYWNVPVDLVAAKVATPVLANGLGWLRARNYEVLSGWDADATVVDPATIDWKAVAEGRTEARVRQRPGPGNSMGAMKFEFPNQQGIYLHDTPDRALFAEAERTFSSGCVRLEDAARLGRWLLGRDPRASSDRPEYHVPLAAGVPVYLTYLTVRPEQDGRLAYAPDVYNLDAPTLAAASLR